MNVFCFRLLLLLLLQLIILFIPSWYTIAKEVLIKTKDPACTKYQWITETLT